MPRSASSTSSTRPARRAGSMLPGRPASWRATARRSRASRPRLERTAVVRRVQGGAMRVERMGFEPALSARDTLLTAEKDRIAKAALAELPEEGSIVLDAGSTTVRLAEMLPIDRQLTVLTNGLPIALALAARTNLTVLFIGGPGPGRTPACVDPRALAALAQ